MTPSKRGGCGYNVMPGLGTYSTRPKDKGRLAREHDFILHHIRKRVGCMLQKYNEECLTCNSSLRRICSTISLKKKKKQKNYYLLIIFKTKKKLK